jgi:hypothetical protein
MDISNPFRSIAPTVDADVLRVLVRTHTALTGMKGGGAGRSLLRAGAVSPASDG